MYLDTGSDYSNFSFGGGNPFGQGKPVLVKDDDGGLINPGSRKVKRRKAFTEQLRRENARLRRPCPKCNNLVQPHLLGQHYEAYHPGVEIPTPPSLSDTNVQ